MLRFIHLLMAQHHTHHNGRETTTFPIFFKYQCKTRKQSYTCAIISIVICYTFRGGWIFLAKKKCPITQIWTNVFTVGLVVHRKSIRSSEFSLWKMGSKNKRGAFIFFCSVYFRRGVAYKRLTFLNRYSPEITVFIYCVILQSHLFLS